MRYVATDKVEHACCYDASVIDTTIEGWNNRVCECRDKETAQRIADALNAQAQRIADALNAQ